MRAGSSSSYRRAMRSKDLSKENQPPSAKKSLAASSKKLAFATTPRNFGFTAPQGLSLATPVTERRTSKRPSTASATANSVKRAKLSIFGCEHAQPALTPSSSQGKHPRERPAPPTPPAPHFSSDQGETVNKTYVRVRPATAHLALQARDCNG